MNTMKRFYFFLSFIGMCLCLPATNYFVATNGSDTNSGTIEKPFATLRKAQSKVVAGDTVYIRRGTYKITESEVMEHHTAGRGRISGSAIPAIRTNVRYLTFRK